MDYEEARRLHLRRAYVYANVFEFWLGLGAALAGVTFFVNPESLSNSSVGEQAGILAVAWSALYMLGGLGVCVGMLGCLRPWGVRVELAGLSLLTAAVLINAVSIVAYRGWAGSGAVVTYTSLAIASILRARYVIRRGRRDALR
jgi:hypothetical protein